MPAHQQSDFVDRLREGQSLEFAGALFDMDGTLVDSIAAVEEAWRLWAIEYGVPSPSPQLHGRAARAVVDASGLPDADRDGAEARLNEIEARPGQRLQPLPGVRRVLSGLPSDRWGVVTSAARPVAHARLAAASLPEPPLLISRDDVVRGKPDPEPFRRGLDIIRQRHTGVVIVVEDTRAGLTSARAAGCFAIGVVGTDPLETLEPLAHVVIPSFEALDVRIDGDRLVLSLATADLPSGAWLSSHGS